MLQFSTFDLFGPLPSPNSASRDFLHQIGQEPDSFQQWLRSINSELADSSDWSAVLRLYVQHRDGTFQYSDDPVKEMQDYGLTRELAEKILENVGEDYGQLLPKQYIVSAVENRLVTALRALPGN